MAQFLRTEGEKPLLKALVDIKPTDVILNDTIWQVHPSQVVVDSGKIDINDFYFSHADRYIRVDGHISDNPEDTVKVNLKDINIGYVFDIARISDDVNFEGDATGMAYASGVLKKPVLDTRLSIMNFTLNGGLLGDLDIYGAWDNEKKGIYLDAHIQEKDISKTHVNGFIYPIKPTSGLDLNIDANNLNIKFLEHYMRSIAQDVRGRASGKVHFYGKFKGLTLDGAVMTDASMKFDILNTSFALKDTIRLAPEGITFDNIHIADMEGHQGKLNGYLHYEHFKNIKYQFDIQVNNMLVMNTQESPDFPFYGTVYATGNALLTGNAQDGLDANIAMTTNRNTNFTYSTGTVASATNNQFIKFVDKTPRRSIQDSVQLVSFYEQVQQKIEKVATNIYGASVITYSTIARKKIKLAAEMGITRYPVCIAKTQYSFSADPKIYGAVNNFEFHIKDIVLNNGAEMIVAIAGEIMRMPGLPKEPQAKHIDIVDGQIDGLS